MTPGFVEIEQDVTIDAPPDRVFDALTAGIGEWWSHRFTVGMPVVFEPWVGGRFFEDWGGGQGALYGVVTALRRSDLIRISGPYGMTGAVTGLASFHLETTDEGGTRVVLSHRAFGDVDEGTQAAYNDGWAGLLGHDLPAYLAVL